MHGPKARVLTSSAFLQSQFVQNFAKPGILEKIKKELIYA